MDSIATNVSMFETILDDEQKELIRALRVPISLRCSLCTPNQKLCTKAETIDISQSGILVKAKKHKIMYGSMIRVQLHLRDGEIEFFCKPAKITSNQIGFRIVDIKEKEQKKLESFLFQLLLEQAA